MKINEPSGTPISKSESSSGTVPANDSARARELARHAFQHDQVQLSQLSAFLAHSLNDSPAQAQKLTQLTGVVSSGSYHVPARVVSDSIIRYSLLHGGASWSGRENATT